jgi:hypothetical protein
VRIYLYIHTYIHIYIHTYIHTHMYTYTDMYETISAMFNVVSGKNVCMYVFVLACVWICTHTHLQITHGCKLASTCSVQSIY